MGKISYDSIYISTAEWKKYLRYDDDDDDGSFVRREERRARRKEDGDEMEGKHACPCIFSISFRSNSRIHFYRWLIFRPATMIPCFIKFQDFNHNLFKFLINTREINIYIYIYLYTHTWNVIDMAYVKSQYLNEISYNTPRFNTRKPAVKFS